MALRRQKKPKGHKRVSYQLINRDDVVGRPVYNLLTELVDAYHTHLQDARIALAWCTSWKPDRDGRCILGKCVKASDLNRELAPFDFVILLKREFWYHESTKPEDRKALLDHELCHAGVTYDERTGEPVYDERGRKVYRIIKHDVEEFSVIGLRYGCWKKDIEHFYAALNRSAREAFKSCGECSTDGWKQTPAGAVRCECYIRWSQRHAEAMAS